MGLFLFIDGPALVCEWVNFPILWPHTLVQMKLKCPPPPPLDDYQVKGLLDEQRKLSLVESINKANIFLGLIDYELNSLLGASHLVDYISVHIRFDLERYLLNISLII